MSAIYKLRTKQMKLRVKSMTGRERLIHRNFHWPSWTPDPRWRRAFLTFSGSSEAKSRFIRSTGAYVSSINGIDTTARTPLTAARTWVGLISFVLRIRSWLRTDEHVFITNGLHNIAGTAVKPGNRKQSVCLSPSCDRTDDRAQQRT